MSHTAGSRLPRTWLTGDDGVLDLLVAAVDMFSLTYTSNETLVSMAKVQ